MKGQHNANKPLVKEKNSEKYCNRCGNIGGWLEKKWGYPEKWIICPVCTLNATKNIKTNT
jgi:HD-like signal output (HDOD) protein